MLEKLAQVSYRYYQEAKVFVILTIFVFGLAMVYANNAGWSDGQGFATLLLFLGVFGNAILYGFCLCVFFICFVYAFHPELNGKEQGNTAKLVVVRGLSVAVSIASAILFYYVMTGHGKI